LFRLELISAIHSSADAAADKRAADLRFGLPATVSDVVSEYAAHHGAGGHVDMLLRWGMRFAGGEQREHEQSWGEVID